MSRRRMSWYPVRPVTTETLLTTLYGSRTRRIDRLPATPAEFAMQQAQARLWRGITMALVLELIAVLVLAVGMALWRWVGG